MENILQAADLIVGSLGSGVNLKLPSAAVGELKSCRFHVVRARVVGQGCGLGVKLHHFLNGFGPLARHIKRKEPK